MSGHKSKKKGSNIICRVSNATPEMVCKYVSRLPKQKMSERAFRRYMGEGWFQNEHQAPEQWGLYYIDGLNYYPRFNREISITEAKLYLYGWMKRLIVINPYTRFKTTNDNRLVESIIHQLEVNPIEHDLKKIIRNILNTDEPFVVNEIIANAINSYSEVLSVKPIDKDDEKFEVSLLPNYKEIIKRKYKMNKKEYFDLFSGIKLTNHQDDPKQQIFYGAPGTGKSHEINRLTEGEEVVRTTFHPDSDYSTFVGAYKPIMKEVDVQVVPVVVDSGIALKPSGTYKEKRITYQFVKQAFLKAYLGAWKKYADGCSICSNPAVHEFSTDHGRYVINSVSIYDLTLSREFLFFKNWVLKEWPNLWKNGTFEVPTGQQSGKSVQHAIANWIFDKTDSCSESSFEEGWKKLIDTIKEKGHVEVQKTKTYNICSVADDGETLTINAEARDKKRVTLQRKFNDSEKVKATKLEKALIDILKGYSNDFDDAWERLKHDVDKGTSPEVKDESDGLINPQFLVIEEINRGNCAQIFGDIFQLLDRADNGFSVYPIEADSDLRDAIKLAFEEEDEYLLPNDIDIEGVIEYTSNYDATLSEDVQSGRVLLLPPNLYIWATMNTSDQSLFPIDSAFKRRWDWVYTPIAQGKDENGKLLMWQIEGQGDNSWWTFIQGINEVIDMTTHSEDKKLGFFFCKAKDSVVKKETFVNKVVFYLWNDVFKVYGFKSDIFDNKDKTEKITFKSFYNDDGSVNEETMSVFVKNVMAKAPKENTDSGKLDVNEEQNVESETQE